MKAIVRTNSPEFGKLNGKTFEVKVVSFTGVTIKVENKMIDFNHDEIFIVDIELELMYRFRWINGFEAKFTEDQMKSLIIEKNCLKKHCDINGIDIF